jgi:hypothetical protein
MDCDIQDYYKAKHRDLPTALDPAADMLQQLDIATSEAMREDTPAAWFIVDVLFNAVLNYPGSTWDKETLNYRQRQLYFK